MAVQFQFDLEERRYPQRVVLEAIGLDAERFKNWTRSGVLVDPRVEERKVKSGRGTARLYSALDVIKLACVARLVALNVPIGVAAQMGQALEMFLTREDLDAIAGGSMAPYPMIVSTQGGRVEIVFAWSEYYSNLPYGDDSRTNPLAAMSSHGIDTAIILDWREIVRASLEKLTSLEK